MTEQAEIHSYFWDEEASHDNPFSPSACFCSGYNVYEDLLTKISWTDYLYLMLQKEPPSPEHSVLLKTLSIALANPGPRDHSVQAAMSGGAGGSTIASCLMAAIGVGAGNLGGAHEVALGLKCWQQFGTDIVAWTQGLQEIARKVADKRSESLPNEGHPLKENLQTTDVWLDIEHAPGFDPNGITCAQTVIQTLDALAEISPGKHLAWLRTNRELIEGVALSPIAMSGVAAAAFCDLGMTPAQAETLYLLLRLPGAAVHALEQHELGWKDFPFFPDGLHLVENNQ